MNESKLDKIDYHPFANIFPMMPDDSKEFMQLKESILQNGIQYPIILYQNQILEGRNRYRCYELEYEQVNLKTVDFTGNDGEALQLVIDSNVHRRHLTDGQRALAAARFSRLQPKHGNKLKTDAYAGEIFSVTDRSMRAAIVVLNSDNHKDLIQAIDSGLLSLHLGEELATVPKDIVQQVIDSDKPSSVAQAYLKKQARQERERLFANNTIKENREAQAQAKDLVYGVIYTDPPWTFETYSELGKTKSAENHYPVMDDDSIRGIKIPAASDCALFMWSTVAKLADAIEILQAWGFDYKSAYFWNKLKPGTGYWSRNTVEVLLLGTKGNVPAPSDFKMEQMIAAAQGKHSEKPKVFAEGIAKMFPTVAKLEMFARNTNNPGENWYYWGNEVGQEIEVITDATPAKRTNRKRNSKKVQKESDISGDGESVESDRQREMVTENTDDGSA